MNLRKIKIRCLVGLAAGALLLAAAGPQPDDRPGGACLVCGQPVGPADARALYRGREVYLHAGACSEAWAASPEVYFTALQPRGALFQEHEEFASPLEDVWLGVGIYVVVGLVFGAVCGYLAVGRGLSPLPWFFCGLALNAVALVALLTRPRADLSRFPGGIPGGLAKVPTTRTPRPCPACGSENHPAARRCAACGAALEPTATAETTRI